MPGNSVQIQSNSRTLAGPRNALLRVVGEDQARKVWTRIQNALEYKFRTRVEGGWSFPRLTRTVINWPGIYTIVQVNVGALGRLRIDQLADDDTLAKLSATLNDERMHIVSMRQLPPSRTGQPGERGLWYVAIHPAMQNYQIKSPTAAPKAELPRMAQMDFLKDRPEGDYMIGFGVARQGQVWRSLEACGNMTVSGMTGFGKSAFLRSLLYQLVNQPLPFELYLVDIEDRTFPWAAHWPMLKRPIARSVEDAERLVDSVLDELNRRSDLYAKSANYPDKWSEFRANTGKTLPWIVVVLDEFSALAKVAGVSSNFMRKVAILVMRCRKYGVTVVLSGNDWSAKVADTGIISQTRTRVQFRAGTPEQSKRVLDVLGAEKLTQEGRAILYLSGEYVDCQTFFVPKEAVLGETLQETGQAVLDRDAPQPQRFSITSDQAQLVVYAAERLAGWFQPDALAVVFGGSWTGHILRKLAAEWENKKWLMREKKPNERGKGATWSRKVTNEFVATARQVLAVTAQVEA